MKFERYAFDLSRFTGGHAGRRPSACASAICGTSRSPTPTIPIYKQMPTHFRAELHDRLIAPIYPIAFTVLCFAILGAPRTSRQSREMSLIMTIVRDRRAAADRLCLQRARGRRPSIAVVRALRIAGRRASRSASTRSRAAS